MVVSGEVRAQLVSVTTIRPYGAQKPTWAKYDENAREFRGIVYGLKRAPVVEVDNARCRVRCTH